MNCPVCGKRLKVIKSESDKNGVMRIRKCTSCRFVTTTFEKIDKPEIRRRDDTNIHNIR